MYSIAQLQRRRQYYEKCINIKYMYIEITRAFTPGSECIRIGGSRVEKQRHRNGYKWQPKMGLGLRRKPFCSVFLLLSTGSEIAAHMVE